MYAYIQPAAQDQDTCTHIQYNTGHETTGSMLTWATWLLSQHPDAQRKMQDEIDVVLQGRRPTFEDMKKLEQVCITVCLCAHVMTLSGRMGMRKLERM